MEKHSAALVDQLQNIHARQRKVIQQLQADSARLLSDLAEVRRERDAFRAEAARLRKEQAELQNRLDEAQSECRDLKREYPTPLSRTLSNAYSSGRPLKVNNKAMNLNILSPLTDGTKSPFLDYSTGTTPNSQNSYSSRELPQPIPADKPARPFRKQPTIPTPIQRSPVYGLSTGS